MVVIVAEVEAMPAEVEGPKHPALDRNHNMQREERSQLLPVCHVAKERQR